MPSHSSSTSSSSKNNQYRRVYTTPSDLRVIATSNPTEEFTKHYSIGKVLGKGSFATVYQATHLETGEQYAVKVIGFNTNDKPADPKKKINTQEEHQKVMTEQLEREITFFSNVPSHPNIIRAKEVYTTIKNDVVAASMNDEQSLATIALLQQTYIVLELASGGDLFDVIIKTQGLSELESRCVLRQLLSAVHHMHASGFTHCDLKPENILLTNNPNIDRGCQCKNADGTPIPQAHITIKVEDFGFTRNKSDIINQEEMLAETVNTNSRKSSVIHPLYLGRTECQGSFAFVNPEKIHTARGKIKAFDSFSADVWSVGVILFMIISACDPFTNSNPSAHGGRTTFDNITCGGFKRAAKVWASPGALDLISKMFTIDLEKRLMSCEQVAEHPWVRGAPYSEQSAEAAADGAVFNDEWSLEDYVLHGQSTVMNLEAKTNSRNHTMNTLESDENIQKHVNEILQQAVAETTHDSTVALAKAAMVAMVTEQIQNGEIAIEKNEDGQIIVTAADHGDDSHSSADATLRVPIIHHHNLTPTASPARPGGSLSGSLNGQELLLVKKGTSENVDIAAANEPKPQIIEVPLSTINSILQQHQGSHRMAAPPGSTQPQDDDISSVIRTQPSLDADSLLLSDLVTSALSTEKFHNL